MVIYSTVSYSKDGYNFSAISDNFFESCHISDEPWAISIAETYRRFFHYDILCVIICLVLIVIPILFKIYGFGVQTQLRNFYNKIRYGFIFTLTLLGLAAGVSSIIHLFIKQQPACLKWDTNRLFLTTNQWSMPSVDAIITVIIADALISLKTRYILLRIIIAVLLVFLDGVVAVKTGMTSVIGAIASYSLGVWIISYNRFVPPICIAISEGVVIIANAILVGISGADFGISFAMTKEANFLSLRGIFVMVISELLFVRFKLTREDFTWFGSGWTDPLTCEESDSGNLAEIPKMDSGNVVSDFGAVLNGDLIDSVISFVVFLFGNFCIGRFPNGPYSFLN